MWWWHDFRVKSGIWSKNQRFSNLLILHQFLITFLRLVFVFDGRRSLTSVEDAFIMKQYRMFLCWTDAPRVRGAVVNHRSDSSAPRTSVRWRAMYLYDALQCVADAPLDGRLVQSVTMNIDTERVITEVRLRPILWDLSNTLYKDRDARIASWLEVCQALNSNYDQLSTSQQKEYGKLTSFIWNLDRYLYYIQ